VDRHRPPSKPPKGWRLTRDRLYDVWRARPFRPFVLRMADGRSTRVRRPEFVCRSQDGRTIAVYVNRVFRLVDVSLVSDIEVSSTTRRGKRRRSA